jgi:hypothetical protein
MVARGIEVLEYVLHIFWTGKINLMVQVLESSLENLKKVQLQDNSLFFQKKES